MNVYFLFFISLLVATGCSKSSSVAQLFDTPHPTTQVTSNPLNGFCSFQGNVGNGTISQPYLICNRQNLENMAAKLADDTTYASYSTKYYKQVADINLGGSGNPFSTIGGSVTTAFNTGSFPQSAPTNKPFQGQYDGNNKKISNFYYASSAAEYTGLFRHIGSSGVVKNLTLETATLNLTGESNVAGLVAAFNEGTIDNITVTGNLSGVDGDYWGLIVGYNMGTVQNSSVTGTLTQTGYGVSYGGVAGANYGTLDTIISTTTINSTDSTYVGGTVGRMFAGTIDNATATLTFPTAGMVEAYLGGIVGYMTGGSLSDSTATVDFDVTSDFTFEVGGIAGELFGTAQVSNSTVSGSIVGVYQSVGGAFGKIAHSGVVVTGVSVSSMTISDVVDVDAGGFVGTMSDGTISNSSVTGLTLSSQAYNAGGFVGEVTKGTLTSNTTAGTVSVALGYAGGFAGSFGVSGNANCQRCTADVDVSSETGVGGFAGDMGRTCGYCKALGDVTGSDQVGGFAGIYEGTSTVTYSEAYGDVTGSTYVGGFIGSGGGAVSNASSFGDVTGFYYVGGFLGSGSGTIRYSRAMGSVTTSVSGDTVKVGGFIGEVNGSMTVVHSYSTGLVSAGVGSSDMGGFIGYKTLTSTISASKCYWDKDSSGLSTSVGGSEVSGQDTPNMYLEGTYSGWDFTAIWNSPAGIQYPTLRNTP